MRLGGRQSDPPPIPSGPIPKQHTHTPPPPPPSGRVCSSARGSLNSPPVCGLAALGAKRSWLCSHPAWAWRRLVKHPPPTPHPCLPPNTPPPTAADSLASLSPLQMSPRSISLIKPALDGEGPLLGQHPALLLVLEGGGGQYRGFWAKRGSLVTLFSPHFHPHPQPARDRQSERGKESQRQKRGEKQNREREIRDGVRKRLRDKKRLRGESERETEKQ